MESAAIVLAAGAGTRMKSRKPKVAHEVLGKPMVRWVIDAAHEAGLSRIVTVVGHERDQVIPLVEGDTQIAEQYVRRGTADAVNSCREQLGDFEGSVVVLSGDCPLITPATIRKLVEMRERADAAVVVLTMELDDPTGYGRIVRDASGEVERIVEQKDANDAEAAITECNSGFYCFDGKALFDALLKVSNNNAQGEFYLTDVLYICREAGRAVLAMPTDDPAECLGVNSRGQLAQATRQLQRRINERLMAEGVTMTDPDLVWVGPDAKVARDVEIKKSTVGKGSKVPHLSYIGDALIGEGVNIGAGSITCNYDGAKKHSTVIGDGAFIGSDTMMVAPVNIGTGAIVGAGSVITEDVQPDSLGIARAEQTEVKGWAEKKRARLGLFSKKK